MSQTHAPPEFERRVGQLSNLDRCTRCGRPRSVHGPDWACPGPLSNRASAMLVVLGIALAAAGFAWRPATGSAGFDVAAAALLVGVCLIVAGFTGVGR